MVLLAVIAPFTLLPLLMAMSSLERHLFGDPVPVEPSLPPTTK